MSEWLNLSLLTILIMFSASTGTKPEETCEDKACKGSDTMSALQSHIQVDTMSTDEESIEKTKASTNFSRHQELRTTDSSDAPFKVFLYDLPSEFTVEKVQFEIDPYWQTARSQQYDAEVAVFRYFKMHPHLTTSNPEEAHLFLIPVFLSHMYENPENGAGQDAMKRVLSYINETYPYWRSRRAHHMVSVVHDFGRCLFQVESEVWKELQDVIVLSHLGDRHQRYNLNCVSTEHDLVMPPLGFHDQLPDLNRSRNRLAMFIGTFHNETNERNEYVFPDYSEGVRQELARLYADDPDIMVKEKVDELDDHTAYQDLLHSTRFCLAPGGWATWSPRAYEAIVFGCIPVFFWGPGDVKLPWDDTLDYKSFALFVPTTMDNVTALSTLKETLQGVDNASIMQMQQRLLEVRRFFSWSLTGEDSGAMSMVLSELKHIQKKAFHNPESL
mmetsp:Transcript_2447/g.2596  ORF Transcript_2447/g.2596 Transcript_2447/m.2596 type:complete len:443 (+) Transcript_2447:87-1415(+)